MSEGLVWALVAAVLGSGLSIGLSALLVFVSARSQAWLIPSLVSFATGSLLGAAFIGLIPTVLETIPPNQCFLTIVLGIMLFFLLEKLIIWRHCHKQRCAVHDVSSSLILIGDGVHNFLDGFALAVAFLASFPVGVTTAFGIFAHELPQELGDFAVLLHSRMSKRRAFILNALSGATAIPGVVVGFYFASAMAAVIPYAMAIAAASFIYIAIADLIPGLHKRIGVWESITQITLIFAGLGTVYLFHGFLH